MSAIRVHLLAAALAAAAAPALADTIYKYERGDGSVVYSDTPVRDARLVERFSVAQATAQPPRPAAPEAQRPAAPAGDRIARLDAADAEVRAAQQAVDAAKTRLGQGSEPLPGERVGIGGGRSRLTQDYFARQQALEEELVRANARLEAAYRQRNDAR